MGLIQESLQILIRPGNNTGQGTTIFTVDNTGAVATSPVKMKQDSNILHDKMQKDVTLVAATATGLIWLCKEGVWVLDGVVVYFQTGSTSGTFTVTVESGTTAPGSGTAQLTGTISLAAAAQQTVISGAVIASPTEIAPGSRVSSLIAGTMTSLANGIASLSFKRIR